MIVFSTENPPEHGSPPVSKVSMAASQSMAAVPVPVWMNRVKSSRFPTVEAASHVMTSYFVSRTCV
jgi:hypothetical protein